ncbi:hypothetical protein EWB00_002994 [Schistosoma japonicum]|uniref:Uncharacterized protein n=1 Tax=Schistosoma japonicum TaxID=6182 RepID=C1LFH5_SCHJA|nr:hypothetical protein EWB00_002994 [Schistosoma japonicum]CAX73453.1 hypothetical protein [Schistosoma japonicum]
MHISNWIFLLSLYLYFTCGLYNNGIQGLELNGRKSDYYPSNRLLYKRSLYDSEVYQIDSKPELRANHGQNFTQITCRINRPKLNAEVYLTCPALGESRIHGNCYQGCQPTNPCGHSTQYQYGCVPHDQTVFCQKTEFPNGTIVLNLKVDRTDKRLTGLWSCIYAGLESTKFEIELKSSPISADEVSPVSKPLVKQTKHETDTNVLHNVRSNQDTSLNNRPMAYMRKPEILFTVLSILILSILINLGFCIRCLLLRSYIDASQEGSSNTSCLAACLCLPDEMRKGSLIMTTPILPRANMNPHMNHVRINGSDQGVFNSSYSLSALQKMPLLHNGTSYKENSPTNYILTNSLPGTFPRHGIQNMRNYSTQQPQFGGLMQPQTLDMENSNLATFPTIDGTNKFVSFTPTYIRAPSLNTPSPNLNRDVMNSFGYSPQTAVRHIGQGEIHSFPQYLIRMQHPHVIYDDVAAGTSSIVGSLNHSPNGSILDTTGLQTHLAQFQNINVVRQSNMSQPTNSSFTNLVNLSSDTNPHSHYISLQPSMNHKPLDGKITTSVPSSFPVQESISTSSPYSDRIQADKPAVPSVSSSTAGSFVNSEQTVKLNNSDNEEANKGAEQLILAQTDH